MGRLDLNNIQPLIQGVKHLHEFAHPYDQHGLKAQTAAAAAAAKCHMLSFYRWLLWAGRPRPSFPPC